MKVVLEYVQAIEVFISKQKKTTLKQGAHNEESSNNWNNCIDLHL